MFEPKMFDELAKKLADVMPPGLQTMRKELEKNFRVVLQSAFSKMDLITREEFDVQREVLARTREMVEELQTKVDRLTDQSK